MYKGKVKLNNNLNKYKKFIFNSFNFNYETGELSLSYSLDNKINFIEKLIFSIDNVDFEKINKKFFEKILFNIHLAFGVSYYKTYCPNKIIINSGKINLSQRKFWTKLYEKGLGEFFYKNKIDWHNLINFPHSGFKSDVFDFQSNNNYLVPFGGGKDSITTIELLKKKDNNFTLFYLDEYELLKNISKEFKYKSYLVKREMSPNLFELNKMGALNGHIPKTALVSFVALALSVLHGYKYVVFSNEKSASYGNINYLGEDINHQYSKSFEFEIDLNKYLEQNLTNDIKIFSLLRPWSEISIIKEFSKHKKYFSHFSSCNVNNFKLNSKKESHWCNKCPKCLFTFILLAAFVKKEDLLNIFKENLFLDINLLPLFLDIIGEGNIKPWECVGEPQEALYALYLAYKRNIFNDDYLVKYFVNNILKKHNFNDLQFKDLFKESADHLIPEDLISLLN